MRTLEDAQPSWQKIHALSSLAEVKSAIWREAGQPTFLRSAYWKILLLFESCNHAEWSQRLADSRSAYVSLRGHFLQGIERPDDFASELDPLSEEGESPWATLRQDEALRAEILQDVDRCMPENTYFRESHTQRILLDILFVFCKLNPDVGYRQGMHELLAPVLWVVEQDAIVRTPASESTMISQLLDSHFIEHDAFTLFGLIMQYARSFYEQAAHRAPSRLITTSPDGPTTLENPIITRINRIFDDYLPHIDPDLAAHLKAIDLIPQVFLMRWIRLLFGREFAFDDVLKIWDIIFAEDASLELVDLICLTMILRLHWDLLDADYNTALTLLLRYPELPSTITPQFLAFDALYLKDHFTTDGASELIAKYTGRRPPLKATSSQLSFGGLLANRITSPIPSTRSLSRSSNFESILQDAAKGMSSRAEKWGLNKAVRDAVEEVRKGVREIQAPQPARRHVRTQSRSSLSDMPRSRPEAMAKMAALRQRSDNLAKMLKAATDELWALQKDAADGKGMDEEAVKALSMAIAKVQFVQVYLEDPSIPLPADEEDERREEAVGQDLRPLSSGDAEVTEEDRTAMKMVEAALAAAKGLDDSGGLADDSAVADEPKKSKGPTDDDKAAMKMVEAALAAADMTASPGPAATSSTALGRRQKDAGAAPANIPPPRPPLAQSSFSWMLGQQQQSGAMLQAAPPPAERRANKGFLFGDDDVGSSDGSSAKVEPKARRKERGKRVGSSVQQGEDGFDLSVVGRGSGNKDS